ncbi:TonB-dependent receptor [Granulicella sp. dw_53]|uniref:TonB-dependent receptor n=1 Tax=Granulicella sp. dw_53 TaxID=2719792 RepID=UPI001BD24ED4|nr:TonB-dependent receptor [Granulicella sp. dw_53]
MLRQKLTAISFSSKQSPSLFELLLIIGLRRTGLIASLCVVLSFPCYLSAQAQQPSTRAFGTVRDSQGMGISASVRLKGQHGPERQVTTSDDGHFAIESLDIGKYDLFIDAKGFASVKRSIDIALASEQLDIRMSPQGMSTEISVFTSESKATASRMDVPDNEIPAQVSTISSQTLREQGINDLVGALRNASGVTAQKIYGVYEYYTIRGFSSFDSQLNVVLSDGMRLEGNRLNTQLNSVDRVEVLKGPSSILYGSGALGGSINIIHKKPQATPTMDLMYRGGSFGTHQVAGGAAGQFFNQDKLLYRVDSSFENSDGWRGAGARRINASPNLTLLLGNCGQVAVSEQYNHDHFKTDAGIPAAILSIPGYNLSTRFDTPQDFELGTDGLTEVRLNVNLSERWEARNNFAYRNFDDQYYTAETLTYLPATNEVARTFLYFKHHRRPKQNLADVLGHFRLAGTEHALVTGYEYEDYYNYTDRSAASSVAAPNINIFSLQENYTPVSAFPISRRDYFAIKTNALFWQDQIALGNRWRINAGGRLDGYRRSSHNDPWNNGRATSRTPDSKIAQNAYTYRAGILYSLTKAQDGYFTAASAFNPVTSISADGKQLIPETGQSYEVGYRWHSTDGRINLSTALYKITRQNVAIGLTGGLFDQAGQVSSRGVDFDATVNPGHAVRINANYGYSLPRFDNYLTSNGAVNLTGKRPDFTQRHAVNLWITKTWRYSVSSSLGMRYLSASFIDNANTFRLGGFTTFQGALSYRHKAYDVSLNAENLLNRHRYFPAGLYQNQVYPGAPISVYATVRFRR